MRAWAIALLAAIALFFMALNLYGIYELITLFTRISSIKHDGLHRSSSTTTSRRPSTSTSATSSTGSSTSSSSTSSSTTTTRYRLKYQFDRTTGSWTKRPVPVVETTTVGYRTSGRPRPRPTTPSWYFFYNGQHSTTSTTTMSTRLPPVVNVDRHSHSQHHILPRPHHPSPGGPPLSRIRPPQPPHLQGFPDTSSAVPLFPLYSEESTESTSPSSTPTPSTLPSTYRIPTRITTSRHDLARHRIHGHHKHDHHHQHQHPPTTTTVPTTTTTEAHTVVSVTPRVVVQWVNAVTSSSATTYRHPHTSTVILTLPPSTTTASTTALTTERLATIVTAPQPEMDSEEETTYLPLITVTRQQQQSPPTTVPQIRIDEGGSEWIGSTYPPEEDGGMTMVTALMDIGRGEWFEYRRPLQKYHSFMENMLSLKVNMVIFTDASSADFVERYRAKQGLANRTKIYNITLEELPLHRYIFHAQKIIEDELKNPDLWKAWDPQMQKHPEAKSPEYDILVNSKTYFLYNASLEDPFHSDWFVWLDAGYGHGDQTPFPVNNVWKPHFPKRRISLIKITPEHDKISEYNLDRLYRQNWSVISGGFIAGDRHSIGQLFSLVHRKVIELINQDRVDDDQTILVLVIKSHPHLFNIVHGEWFDAFKLFPSRIQ